MLRLIHNLRIYFLAIIVFGFFAALGLNPVSLGRFIGATAGRAVGMSTSVPENPFNKLALELKDKEDRLAQRERLLEEREKAAQLAGLGQETLIQYMAGGIIVLFLLVAYNYYLDWKRKRTIIADKKISRPENN